jgi:hypothetical protein
MPAVLLQTVNWYPPARQHGMIFDHEHGLVLFRVTTAPKKKNSSDSWAGKYSVQGPVPSTKELRLRYPDWPGDLTSREVTRIDTKWTLNYDYWTQHILGQRPAHEPNQWGESLEQQIWVKSSWPRPSSCSHVYVLSLLIHITVLASCEFMRL